MVKWTPDASKAQLLWTTEGEWSGSVDDSAEIRISTIARYVNLSGLAMEEITVSGLPAKSYHLLDSIERSREASQRAKAEEQSSLSELCHALQSEGLALADISNIVGLSKQRIHQIVRG